MRRLSLIAAVAIAALPAAAAGPAAGQLPVKPEDVLRVERAVTDLAAAKRGAAGDVAANRRAAARAMGRCRRGGRGWRRIRSVRVPAQRGLYTRGARILWRELSDVAAERAVLDAYRRPFERFLARFERPLGDPVLQAGVDAWRKRLAYHEAATGFATCRSFERLLRPVRQFAEKVRADYLAGDIYNIDKADKFPVDRLVSEASPDEYDGLILPGGTVNPDNLRQDEGAIAFLQGFFKTGKPVGVICHGPVTLAEADLVRGRTLTSYPSIRTDIRNAGGNVVDEEVVTDQGLVSSRNPDDLPAFCAKIVEEFAEGVHEVHDEGATAAGRV